MRAIAPDLRGYGESERPEGVEPYRLFHSVADVIAVLDALGVERAHVVAHDWGAGVAWALAATARDRVDRLVAMSVGHLGRGQRSVEARQKGWYQLFFQFEDVAEPLLARDDWRLFREIFAGHPDLDACIADLARPGALTAALSWYRANLAPARELEPRRPLPPVAGPVLGLWSSGDGFLTEAQMRNSGDQVEGEFRYERIDGAGHWMQLDQPERINDLLLEFLA